MILSDLISTRCLVSTLISMTPLESSLNGWDKLIAEGARNSTGNPFNICLCLLETLT